MTDHSDLVSDGKPLDQGHGEAEGEHRVSFIGILSKSRHYNEKKPRYF